MNSKCSKSFQGLLANPMPHILSCLFWCLERQSNNVSSLILFVIKIPPCLIIYRTLTSWQFRSLSLRSVSVVVRCLSKVSFSFYNNNNNNQQQSPRWSLRFFSVLSLQLLKLLHNWEDHFHFYPTTTTTTKMMMVTSKGWPESLLIFKSRLCYLP